MLSLCIIRQELGWKILHQNGNIYAVKNGKIDFLGKESDA